MQSVMENIKVQENYFYKLDNLKEVKVIWKKYDKANILEIGIEYPTAIVDLDRFSGIPITKEWLLKFGFFIVKTNGLIEATLPNFRFTLNQVKDYNGFFFCENENVLMNIDYVHELQDLFSAFLKRDLVFSDAVS